MTKPKLFTAAAILAAMVAAPSLAQARSHVRVHPLPYAISYNHNYGPGPLPGTFAYYDGRSRFCEQSAATYIGQDRRRHPCN